MARTFTSTSYAEVNTAAITAYPFTMACWFRPGNVTTESPLMFVGDKDAASFFCALHARGQEAGDPVAALAHNYGGATVPYAVTSTSYVASSWQHACGVWTSASSRAAYLNGGGKGTNTTATNAMSAHDRTSIGRYGDSTPLALTANCDIAEAAIWDVALTDDEVAQLGRGYAPLMVRPSSLVFYAPLVGYASPELNYGDSALALTLTGTPAAAPHPPIIYPRRRRVYAPLAVTTQSQAPRSYHYFTHVWG